MLTTDDPVVAAGHSVEPAGWQVLLDEALDCVAARLGRVEPRRTTRDLVLGLLSPVERKNSQPVDPYHHARHASPIALTAAEIRRLFHALVVVPQGTLTITASQAAIHTQHWSDWRRLHQGRARRSHYQRRLATELPT